MHKQCFSYLCIIFVYISFLRSLFFLLPPSPSQSAPFHPPVFGASLDEVMELQGETHPHLPIPWVVTALCDVILALKGPQTEGIFRCVVLTGTPLFIRTPLK